MKINNLNIKISAITIIFLTVFFLTCVFIPPAALANPNLIGPSGLIYAPQFGAERGINFTKERKHSLTGDLFDFGYALTVHKAQGSQAKKVVMFEERFTRMDDEMWRRWLYTGVTRAEEELYLFGA